MNVPNTPQSSCARLDPAGTAGAGTTLPVTQADQMPLLQASGNLNPWTFSLSQSFTVTLKYHLMENMHIYSLKLLCMDLYFRSAAYQFCAISSPFPLLSGMVLLAS